MSEIITTAPTALSTTMQRHVDRTLAADRKGGEALWEKALAVADARAEAEPGEWYSYLSATGLEERAARRLIAIAERGRTEARFRDAIITGWLSFSVAAIAAKADDELLTNLLEQPAPPTARQLTPSHPATLPGQLPPGSLTARGIALDVDLAHIPDGWDTWRARALALPGGNLTMNNIGVATLIVNGVVSRKAYSGRADHWARLTEAIAQHEARYAPPPPPEPADPADDTITVPVDELFGPIMRKMLDVRGWEPTGATRPEEGGRLYELIAPPNPGSGVRNRLWKTRAGIDAIVRAPVADASAAPAADDDRLTAEEKALLAGLGIEVLGERSPAGSPPIVMVRTAGASVSETDRTTLRRTLQAAREWPNGTRVQTPRGPGRVSIIGRLGTAGQVAVALDGAPITAGMPWIAVADLLPLDEEAAPAPSSAAPPVCRACKQPFPPDSWAEGGRCAVCVCLAKAQAGAPGMAWLVRTANTEAQKIRDAEVRAGRLAEVADVAAALGAALDAHELAPPEGGPVPGPASRQEEGALPDDLTEKLAKVHAVAVAQTAAREAAAVAAEGDNDTAELWPEDDEPAAEWTEIDDEERTVVTLYTAGLAEPAAEAVAQIAYSLLLLARGHAHAVDVAELTRLTHALDDVEMHARGTLQTALSLVAGDAEALADRQVGKAA